MGEADILGGLEGASDLMPAAAVQDSGSGSDSPLALLLELLARVKGKGATGHRLLHLEHIKRGRTVGQGAS